MGFADSVLEPSTRLTSVGKTGLLCFLYSFVFSSPVFIQSRAQLLKPLTPNNNEYMLYGDQDPELDEFYGVFRKYWAEAEGHDGYMDPEILEDTKGFKNGDEEMEAGEGQGAETPTPPQAASSVMPPPCSSQKRSDPNRRTALNGAAAHTGIEVSEFNRFFFWEEKGLHVFFNVRDA